MRLNDMAQVRAQNIAARISRNVRQPGQPWFPRAATAMEATANGSANTVCDSLTNPAQRRRALAGEDGEWKMEDGEWDMEDGGWRRNRLLGFR
jgi:hypothetical protein